MLFFLILCVFETFRNKTYLLATPQKNIYRRINTNVYNPPEIFTNVLKSKKIDSTNQALT